LGKIEATGKITIDRAELSSIIDAAPNKRLQNIGEFDIEVNYLPEGSVPRTDVLRNCRFKNTVGGASEGDSNVEAELELAVSHISWNN
jgi:hypothetical protein